MDTLYSSKQPNSLTGTVSNVGVPMLISGNKKFRLLLQKNGTLSAYSDHGDIFFQTPKLTTSDVGPYNMVMQSDGNLVIYDSSTPMQAVWNTGTNGKGVAPYTLIIQDDRNIVVYDSKMTPLWSSTTNVPSENINNNEYFDGYYCNWVVLLVLIIIIVMLMMYKFG